jgi:hypothetical protein
VFLGHFGLGFAGERVAPVVGLGTLFLSVQFADLLFWILALLGVEHFRIAPGVTVVTPFDFNDYPISHSIALAGWGALLGGVYLGIRRHPLEAAVVAAGVVSHWVLDVLVHRPDMPVLPHGPYVGLGLWNSVPLTVLAELVLYAGGILLYVNATRSIDHFGTWVLWALVLFLAAVWAVSVAGPPPPDERTVELTGLAMWLFVPWGYWIDRHRALGSRA